MTNTIKAKANRDDRQTQLCRRATETFGAEQTRSIPQRGLRLLEEAVEAFQAAGGTPRMAHKTVDYVFDRPIGKLSQEIGGVGVCVLALAGAAGLSADEEEQREVTRILNRPTEEFRRRNDAKNAAGLLMIGKAAPGPRRSGKKGDSRP